MFVTNRLTNTVPPCRCRRLRCDDLSDDALPERMSRGGHRGQHQCHTGPHNIPISPAWPASPGGDRSAATSRRPRPRCGINGSDSLDWTARGLLTRTARGVYRFTAAGPRHGRTSSLASCSRRAAWRADVRPSRCTGSSRRRRSPTCSSARRRPSQQPAPHDAHVAAANEYTVVDGLRALHPVRAILDAAHRVPRKQAVEMIERAIVRNLVDPFDLERRARELRNAKRPGCKVVLEILHELHPELRLSRNEWEALVVRRCKELGLPQPVLEYEDLDRRGALLPRCRLATETGHTRVRRARPAHASARCTTTTAGAATTSPQAGWTRFGITATEARRQNSEGVPSGPTCAR